MSHNLFYETFLYATVLKLTNGVGIDRIFT